jgi:hypothetical protein
MGLFNALSTILLAISNLCMQMLHPENSLYEQSSMKPLEAKIFSSNTLETGQMDAALLRSYGLEAQNGEVDGHCCFTSFNVRLPLPCRHYT